MNYMRVISAHVMILYLQQSTPELHRLICSLHDPAPLAIHVPTQHVIATAPLDHHSRPGPTAASLNCHYAPSTIMQPLTLPSKMQV